MQPPLRLSRIHILCTASFFFLANLMSQPVDPAAQITSLLSAFNKTNAPGASVMVIKDGKVVFSKAYGLANLDTKELCTTNTNFRLASVSKQFTAMAILILAEQKKLSLEDPLTKFFPEFPAYGNEITVRHLLAHRSGVLDYEDVIPEGTTIPLSDKNVLHLVAKGDKTYFPPGTQFRYSNTGYAFLALIVEVVSGHTFPEFLKLKIFQPLGMSNTVAYEPGVCRVAQRAFGYGEKDGRFEFSDQSVTSAVLGDGGIYSSTADLFKWDQALYTEKLISRALLNEAFTMASDSSDMKGFGYGFGWYIGNVTGVPSVWHYGSTCGFSTRIHRFPGKKLAVIILTNRRNAPLEGIPEKIAALYLSAP